MKIEIIITEPIGRSRRNEPVFVPLSGAGGREAPLHAGVVTETGAIIPAQIFVDSDGTESAVFVFSCNRGEKKRATLEWSPAETAAGTMFKQCKADKRSGGIRKIDTGVYIAQIGTGLADGSMQGKWGLTFLQRKDEGINLIDGNSFGGVYGPFFTQENACKAYDEELGIGAQHYSMTFKELDNGPVLYRCLLEGTPPAGADENVKEKRIQAFFSFYHSSDWFDREYTIDDYETVIWGETIKNNLTVGDETNVSKNGRTAFQEIRFFTPERGFSRYLLGDPPRKSEIARDWLNIVDKCIFPFDLKYFALRNRYDNSALLYAYSETIRALQIVNRESCSQGRFKDWVNIGTNGFCEIPYLPGGTRIRNGYITSENPEIEMQKMTHPLQVDIVK
ncbi:hypothetical protein GF407_17140 [candidate division KSB1 bacterium]|nr:hypothetical protein [candidate division KSB1 bacterium]